MIARLTSDLVLAADIPASGAFVPIGKMHIPGPALTAALRNLEDTPPDPELLEAAVHALAANTAGLCTLDSGDIANVLQACFAVQLAAEWRIEMPGAGILQALFTVARFELLAEESRTFALGLRLAGKPEFFALKDQAPKVL
jgi:hypothetical protein